MLELRILITLTNLLPPKIHHTKQPNMSKSILNSTYPSPSFRFSLLPNTLLVWKLGLTSLEFFFLSDATLTNFYSHTDD